MTPRPDIALGSAPERAEPSADMADALASFLIARLPALAQEFAAGQTDAVQPVMPTSPAWMRDIAAGRVLTTNDAMVICNVTTAEAVQSRCRRAEQDQRPIGICFAGLWLIDLELLLNSIGPAGTPARLSAESRAKKLPKFCSDKTLRLKK
jgi:predicted transcriptional regulator